MAAVLDHIVTASKKANDIIQSTTSIFARKSPEKSFTDVGALLNSTLAMVAGNARANDVLVELAVEGQPRPVAIQQLQIQLALLNLFQNAVEALSRSSEPRRNLKVRCLPWVDTVNNPGEDPA
jgi:C4-dicarboxylate-specific signal transduction histidine kinase